MKLAIRPKNNPIGTAAQTMSHNRKGGNFFKAGAASGTVAKSISAYDMTFSDAIYGKEKSGRYVCQSRVEKMMNYEYDLLIERLGQSHKQCNHWAQRLPNSPVQHF